MTRGITRLGSGHARSVMEPATGVRSRLLVALSVRRSTVRRAHLLRLAAAASLLALGYFAGARLGMAFALVGHDASPVWPPAGMAVAALYFGGPFLAMGVAAGALSFGLANGASALTAVLAASGAVAEAWLAVALLRRMAFRPAMDRLVDVPKLIVGAAVAASVGAMVGVAGLWAGGGLAPDGTPLAWVAWWVGDALSILVVGGLLLTWLAAREGVSAPARPVETLASFAAVVAVSVLLFFDLLDLRSSGEAVSFPVFPVVIWIAFRIGPRGTALAAVAFSTVAIAATERGLGPFVGSTREGSLLYVALFIAFATASGAAVAAVVAERDADRRRVEAASLQHARDLRELQAVHAIGQTLAEHGPTPASLDSVVGALADVFGYSHPSIYTGDEHTVRLGASRGYATLFEAVDNAEGVMGRVMRTNEAQFVPDVGADPDFVRADPLVVSEISCPLRSQGQFLGVLNVESRRPLDRRDLATVSVVADRVAAALALALEREKLSHLAVHDGLTDLHNRRYLDEALTQLRAGRARLPRDAAAPLAVILFDLDHFGDFNKQHGHQTGDDVLRSFADVLRRQFRGSDILARFGGEEFVAVLPGGGADDAARAAERVRSAFARCRITTPGGEPLRVTVSAGCAGSTDVALSPEALISRADVGLAMAKRAGRDRVVVA